MKTPKEIGETIRQLRGDRSLREFAALCGISHTSLDNIEKGFDFRTGKPTHPSAFTLKKIANAVNVSLDYIIADDAKNIGANFAERLKEVLTTQNIRPSVLSSKTGISEAAISHYLKGDYEPKRDKKQLLATALHVSEAWLCGFDAPMCENIKCIPHPNNQNKNTIFAERLQLALANKNMRKSKLAEIVGIDRSYITNYLSQRYTPSFAMLRKISDALGVSPAWLEGYDVPMIQNILPEEMEDLLGDIEKELLKICKTLDMRKKNMLLTKAYELLEG